MIRGQKGSGRDEDPGTDPAATRDPLFSVAGLRILVAGGASGLGRALAEGFAARGARCLVADVREAAAAKTAAALAGGGHEGCAIDVRDAASCAAAVGRAVSGGGLDVLINCAGRLHLAPALELDPEDFESVLNLNTSGAFVVAREAARAMQACGKGGRIITLASVSSRVANEHYAAYAASKGALVQLTRILALEWAVYGITVNAIGPAMTPTGMTSAYLEDESRRRQALEAIPMGRFGAPQDILGMAILLAAPGGAYITGQTLFVDGGRTLK